MTEVIVPNDHRALILTGGASRRMGVDKSRLLVGGRPVAERIASSLKADGWAVTVLGREPIPGFEFLSDEEPLAGPLPALRRVPSPLAIVLVVACDAVRFGPDSAKALLKGIASSQAAVPVVGGREQPLCALYTGTAFDVLQRRPDLVRVRDWLGCLNVTRLDEAALELLGADPQSYLGANTPAELQVLLDMSGPSANDANDLKTSG